MKQVFQSLIDRTRAPLHLAQVKTIFGTKKRPCRRKMQHGRYEVTVQTPVYNLTVFKVHYGKLTLKIYTKGERVLRIEVIVHNTKELTCGRSLPNFCKIVQLLKEMLERFLDRLHFMDVCFIADQTLEKLPLASRVGKTKVGGVDFNRPRMRAVALAVIALATSPEGFTASQLAQKVATLSNPPSSGYGPRHAAYDLKKLRGKKLLDKIDSSHRYQSTSQGIRALTALMVLRYKVIKPLLASSCQLKRGPKPKNTTPIDHRYHQLQLDMRNFFQPQEKHRQLFLHAISVSA